MAATGIDDGQALTPEAAEALDIEIALDSSDQLFRADLTVDGVPLLEDLKPEADGTTVRIRPADLVETELVEQALAEGEHKIELSVGPDVPRRLHVQLELRRRQHRPEARAARQPRPRPDRRRRSPCTARSRTAPSSASAARRSTSTTVSFAVDFDTPPTGALEFTAVDEAGNRTTAHVVVPVIYPDSSTPST